MRLLVSVSDAAEASAAVAGGADFVDAKNPRAGALGAVSLDALRQIYRACGGRRPVTAALGDARDETIEADARDWCRAGASLVKIGFLGVGNAAQIASIIAAAVRGAADAHSHGSAPDASHDAGVIAVAYADADRTHTVTPMALIDVAARAGANGVLIDTAHKRGPGLRGLLTADAIAAWVRRAHEAGLLAAVAGKLTADDLQAIQDCGADVAGVRGAACDGGRTGRVVADRVQTLRARCDVPGVRL